MEDRKPELLLKWKQEKKKPSFELLNVVESRETKSKRDERVATVTVPTLESTATYLVTERWHKRAPLSPLR